MQYCSTQVVRQQHYRSVVIVGRHFSPSIRRCLYGLVAQLRMKGSLPAERCRDIYCISVDKISSHFRYLLILTRNLNNHPIIISESQCYFYDTIRFCETAWKHSFSLIHPSYQTWLVTVVCQSVSSGELCRDDGVIKTWTTSLTTLAPLVKPVLVLKSRERSVSGVVG